MDRRVWHCAGVGRGEGCSNVVKGPIKACCTHSSPVFIVFTTALHTPFIYIHSNILLVSSVVHGLLRINNPVNRRV